MFHSISIWIQTYNFISHRQTCAQIICHNLGCTTHHNLSIPHYKSAYSQSLPTCLYFCLCVSLYSPHPHLLSSNPGSQGITPRRRSKCHRITSSQLLLPPFFVARYSTEIFKKINPSRVYSAFHYPPEPSMNRPAVCERVLVPSLQAHSGWQLVGSCRFSSKLHKQSKLDVQPSLEAKPMCAIHTLVPVWGQWLQPHSPLHTPTHSLPHTIFFSSRILSSFSLSFLQRS